MIEELVRGDTLDKLINRYSPMTRAKKQILNEPNSELPYYVKPHYPILKNKYEKEMEVGKFKKFMKIFTKLHVSIPFCEALEQILVYA